MASRSRTAPGAMQWLHSTVSAWAARLLLHWPPLPTWLLRSCSASFSTVVSVGRLMNRPSDTTMHQGRSFLASLAFVTLVNCSPKTDSQPPSKPATQTDSAATARAPEIVASRSSAPLAPMQVGNGVTAPIVIKRVDPDYKLCAGVKVLGSPALEAVIDERGIVCNPRLLKPVHPCLEKAIFDAIGQWRFRPGTFKGKPVAVRYNFTVRIHYR